eukprot:6757699-Ditylum_brightwellii.AAC.1
MTTKLPKNAGVFLAALRAIEVPYDTKICLRKIQLRHVINSALVNSVCVPLLAFPCYFASDDGSVEAVGEGGRIDYRGGVVDDVGDEGAGVEEAAGFLEGGEIDGAE